MKTTRRILTAGALGLTLSLNIVTAAEDQNKQSQRNQERQAQREQRLGQIHTSESIIGREIAGSGGRTLGKINDVIVDMESGRILFVVLNLSGDGDNNQVAVPATLFRVNMGGGELGRAAQGKSAFRAEVDREALAGAPQFTSNESEDKASAAFLDKVYRHFNQTAWWAGEQGSAAGEFKHVRRASRLDNFAVQDVSSTKLGDVETVLFDIPAGRMVYVLLDPANQVAESGHLLPVPPMALTKGAEGTLTLGVDREKLKGAPKLDRSELKQADLQKLRNPQFAQQVYDYYGKKAWFEGQTVLSPTGPDRARSSDDN